MVIVTTVIGLVTLAVWYVSLYRQWARGLR